MGIPSIKLYFYGFEVGGKLHDGFNWIQIFSLRLSNQMGLVKFKKLLIESKQIVKFKEIELRVTGFTSPVAHDHPVWMIWIAGKYNTERCLRILTLKCSIVLRSLFPLWHQW